MNNAKKHVLPSIVNNNEAKLFFDNNKKTTTIIERNAIQSGDL